MQQLYVLRYGEIALKGKNRYSFESQLMKNIKNMLKDIDEVSITKEHGRIFVSCRDYDKLLVEEKLSRIFGLVSFSPASKVELDLNAFENTAKLQLDNLGLDKPTSFKVDVKRSNKNFHMNTPELVRHLGGILLAYSPYLKVDVHNPEITVNVDVRDQAYIFTQVLKGQGGMPYKTGGKAMLLLSGGIDSPVAGYMMAKRGIELEAIHFHSYPYTSERAQEKVWTLARKICRYTGRLRVHAINLLEIQREIAAKCPSSQMTILSRRFMMAIATEVSKSRNAQALVTGESLGQVASQTVEGIAVTTDATDLPVLRPLIALDKVDIMAVAHKIDTFETSILPYEDCCTVFLPDKVVTKPQVEVIRQSESLLDVEGLIKRAVEEMTVHLMYEETDFDF